MKLKMWQWVCLAFIAYLVFLIKLMPASWLIHSNIASLPKDVLISGVSGTVWQGKANRVIVQGVAIDKVSWDLSFYSLLLGQINADVLGGKLRDKDAVYLKGNVTAYMFNQNAFDLTNTSILIPAQSVLGQVELPVPITAQGRFKADIATLEFDNTCQVLSGSGGWNNGMVNGLQGPIEFGSFYALFNCTDNDLEITITPDNILQLSAMISIKNKGGFAVDGKFKVPQDMPQEVQQAAVFFGPVDAQGFSKIDL